MKYSPNTLRLIDEDGEVHRLGSGSNKLAKHWIHSPKTSWMASDDIEEIEDFPRPNYPAGQMEELLSKMFKSPVTKLRVRGLSKAAMGLFRGCIVQDDEGHHFLLLTSKVYEDLTELVKMLSKIDDFTFVTITSKDRNAINAIHAEATSKIFAQACREASDDLRP